MSRILHHVGRNDFKKTHQRQIGEQKERAAQKLKEWQEAEAERKQIEEAAKPYKSDWREETQLQESDWTPVAGSIANSTSQTFVHPTGATTTVSGLGGVETTPSTVTIDAFGDRFDVPAPEYGQYGLQGYALPLGNINRRRDYEDVNPKLDASQEFASVVKSDVLMNARVQNPKTTSVGYFSYMTPAEQLEQAKDAKKRFAGGLGNHNFNDHVKGVVGYEKYQQLDDQRKANEESATRDIWDQYKEAIRSGKYELTDKLQKQAEKIQSKVYRDFVDKVEALYFDEFKKQTGLDPFGNKTSTPDAPEDSTDSPNDISTIDAPIEDPYFQRIFPNEPVPTPDAGTLQNSLFDDIEAYDKLTLSQKDAVLKAYERSLKNFTPPPALRDYRNASPVSGTAMGANLGAAKKIMIDYLTKDWDNRVVADNEYLGRDYIDNQFFKNVIFDNDKTVVGGADAVVGTGQPPRVDPKTGEIVVRANFDFNKNEYEASGDPEKQEFAQRLKRFGGMSDYALDAIVDGLPGNLGTLAGMAISPFVAGSKSIGRGNNIPIVIRFTPQELKRKNKEQYDQLVRMGLIKESTFDKIKKHR
jgi:hypothetical protein